MTGKFVSYLRVSTERQGRSGLGLEAQRAAVTEYLNGGDWTLIREFIEVALVHKSGPVASAKPGTGVWDRLPPSSG